MDSFDDTNENEPSGSNGRYSLTRGDLLEHCLDIAREYDDKHSMILTLRQMYYQLVARGFCESGQKVYKRASATC